jgi:hypothetical protein
MARPTKLVFMGLLLAGVIGIAGWLNLLRLEANLRTSVENCQREAKADALTPKAKEFDLVLDCEPGSLTADSFKVGYVRPRGAQGEIVDAQRALWNHSIDAYAIAAISVFFFCAIPWCWYFLLRRLREVSDAIRGIR